MSAAPPPSGSALAQRVRELAADTPYEVRPTERGSEVTLTAVDARWTTLMYRNGLRKAVAHQVRMAEEERSYDVTDRTLDVEWQVGADVAGGVPTPRFRYAAEATSGRASGTSRGLRSGLRDDGTPGIAAEWDLGLGEGRELVRRAAAELGWQERMPRDQRIGLVAGLAGGAVALVVLVAVLLVVLLG